MLRRNFLIGSSSLIVPDGAIAESFSATKAAQDLAESLCRRDGIPWHIKAEPDFILIFRKAC